MRFSVSQCFSYMRKIQKGGPFVNSEFYAGWLSHWREPIPQINSDDVVRVAKDMLAANASFNFYMFHGGTNFGFTAGANKDDNLKNAVYSPQLTSYDYDAPLNEAGDPTEKYFKIKKLLEKGVGICKKKNQKVRFYYISFIISFCRTLPCRTKYGPVQRLKAITEDSLCSRWLVSSKRLRNGFGQSKVTSRWRLRVWTSTRDS